ncbi:MAG: MBL fold metallo-hydrolase [Flavobacteriales bacterium]|nr:MBL fold metallo-hydrolase [Flavobacteriales bacterium]
MRIRFLGTGTSQGVPVVACNCAVCASNDPCDKRLRTSALVSVGDCNLLIDAGPDMRQQLLRAKVIQLDAVLLTHEHMDHIAGIDDLRAFNFVQEKAMDVYANADTCAAVERVYHYAFAKDRYPGVPELRLHRITAPSFEVAGVNVGTVEVMHMNMAVLGFCFRTSAHGGLAYITDAKTISDDAIASLQGVHTLVLNALRRKEHPSHFNLAEALAMVERIRPQQAYFTHISHLLGKHTMVSRELPANVHLAYDGLVLELPA